MNIKLTGRSAAAAAADGEDRDVRACVCGFELRFVGNGGTGHGP